MSFFKDIYNNIFGESPNDNNNNDLNIMNDDYISITINNIEDMLQPEITEYATKNPWNYPQYTPTNKKSA